MVGLGDLMDSACEQEGAEPVLTRLADHGNGRSVDAELDTGREGPSISLNCSPLLQTRWCFFEGGRSLGFGEHPLPQVNHLCNSCTSLAEDPSEPLRAALHFPA